MGIDLEDKYECKELDPVCEQERRYHIKQAIVKKFLEFGKSKWWGLPIGGKLGKKMCEGLNTFAKPVLGMFKIDAKQFFKENCN